MSVSDIPVFGATYANQYDALNHDKDYDDECNRLEEVFTRYAVRPIRRILDLGCGTGQHAIRLAARGFEVLGVDRSSDMVNVARYRSSSLSQIGHPPSPVFQVGDMRDLTLNRSFDAVTLMFAVLGYVTETRDVLSVFTAAFHYLEPGGLLVFDVWHGPAVLSVRPHERIKVVHTGPETLIRVAKPALDVPNHRCDVHYQLWKLVGNRVMEQIVEIHPMRFFFPLEIRYLLEEAGFATVWMSRFESLDAPLDLETWNMLVVARKALDPPQDGD